MLQTFFLGGYTKRLNKGISTVTFNSETLKFGPVTPVAALNNPTWLTFNDNKDLLFAINKEEKGGLTLFTKDVNGIFIRHSDCFVTESAGCHITYLESKRTVYVSNYHEGSVDVFYLDENNQLSLLERIFHQGSSVHPNQKSPHVHMTQLSTNHDYLYVCDLGTDEVYTYQIKEDGTLTEFDVTKFPAGTGPRHLVIHPTLPVIYVVGELNNTTTIVKINRDDTLSVIDSLRNTTPSFATTSAGAAIRLTKDGKFLYVSTRFHNMITVFQVDEFGLLDEIQKMPTFGEIPRDFILDSTEQYLLIPHQDSDIITVMLRDKKSGQLRKIRPTVVAPECVNIVPYAVEK